MGKNTLTNAMLIILISLVFLTLIIMVLFGEKGLINKGKEHYNDTHIEDMQQDDNTVVVKKQ